MHDMQVKLYNRNKFDYSEMYNGTMINIPAGGHIVMDYEHANRFMGKMPAIKKDKHGNQLPESYKWLEMDIDDKRKAELAMRNEAEDKAEKVFVCYKCSKEFASKRSLIAHVKKEHVEDLADKNTRDELEDIET